jgi:ubiquinone/menaquinone biosynthesis C-methylase UbiE
MRWFLRESTVGREPLPVAMSAVGRGERVVQVGVDEPSVAGAIAARPGLNGQAVIVARDATSAARARDAVADAGALVDILVHAPDALPFEDGSFDVAVVHNRGRWLATSGTAGTAIAECLRILRTGGRAVVFETGTATGLLSRLRGPRAVAGDGTERLLERAGFRAVRLLADREGYRFVEGVKG